ncbi:hypothetical protein D3C81_1597620 [compost metagenome]
MVERVEAPEHGAETARVGVAQHQPRFQLDIDVLVLGRRQAQFDQAQVTRHAQVADQGADLGIDQQVLGAPLDANDTLPRQPHIQVFGDWPAQAPVTHHHAADPLAYQMGCDTPPGGFYFG